MINLVEFIQRISKALEFKQKATKELFAYLVYKEGVYCTNGEIVALLWGGDATKQVYLRKLLSDMRECFRDNGLEDVILKKYGKTSVNMDVIQCDGTPQDISKSYGWIE